MNLSNFTTTIKKIRTHPEAGLQGLLRHGLWQLKRMLPFRPFEVHISSSSILYIREPSEVNGCVALAWSMGKYDYNNMSLIQDVQKNDENFDCFFDIGGNVGTYALVASEVGTISVHSFEPHPQTADVLESNIERNGRENVSVHRLAISDEVGVISFQDEKGSPLNQVVENSSAKTIDVERTTGEKFCENYQVKPKMMKIDIEGHELEAIRGFRGALGECRIVFLEENHNAAETLAELPDGFIGPYYVNHRQRLISKSRCNFFEDAVYLNKNYLPEFLDKNDFELRK